jgi:regulator of replication initiation timing
MNNKKLINAIFDEDTKNLSVDVTELYTKIEELEKKIKTIEEENEKRYNYLFNLIRCVTYH